MRNNQPVTEREFDYPGHWMLVSATDTAGRITHCNQTFVEASGFTFGELLGQPHNIVRHPSMPAEAYRDLWATIAAGQAWTGLVKNRRKNGDHYWVQANVTPILDNGQPVGYLSVRTKPTRAQVQDAEALYTRINAQEAGLALRNGHLQRAGLVGLLDRWKRSSATLHLGLLLLSVCALALVPGLFLPLQTAYLAQSAVLVMGAVLVLGWFQSRVVHPLTVAETFARDVAACNLTQPLTAQGPEPIARLTRNLSQIQVNLRAVVGDVRAEVEGFSQAAQEIASASLDLSQRTEAQASNLQQTAASMEQISATVKNTASNADAMLKQTRHSADVAATGQDAIHAVESAMGDIERSSDRMSEIIGAIEGIAFQTNILALNAAVEAARAGEAGRGFAVVAGEVRSLAQRSASASKEIRELIQASVHQVGDGAQRMHGASSTIDQVVQEVRSTTEVVQEIREANAEQAQGLLQINTAIAQLDNVTQQNAAMVEETSSAAQALSAGSEALRRSVGIFRL